MPVFYKLRQNTIKDSKVNGKWFAHTVQPSTMSYKELCKHIAEHGSVYTQDVCVGVGMKLLDCLVEQLLEGKAVKLGDIGTFSIAMKTKGTDTVGEFSLAEHLTKLYIRFQSNRTKDSETSPKAIRARAAIANITNLGNNAEHDAREQEKQDQSEPIEP